MTISHTVVTDKFGESEIGWYLDSAYPCVALRITSDNILKVLVWTAPPTNGFGPLLEVYSQVHDFVKTFDRLRDETGLVGRHLLDATMKDLKW